MKLFFVIIAAALVSMALGGCAAPSGVMQPSGNVYERGAHLREGRVVGAVVLSVRPVMVAAAPGDQAAITSAATVIGAIAGVALGGSDAGARAALGIVGALSGGALGRAVVQDSGLVQAHEIVVRTDDLRGRLIAVVQQGATPTVGSRVWVIGVGPNTRVSPQ